MAAGGEQTATGYKYTLNIHVTESAGTNAKINTVDVVFYKDGSVFAQIESPYGPEAWLNENNTIAAFGVLNTRDLVIDDDVTGIFADRVDAKLDYVDGLQNTAALTVTSKIPPLAGPAPGSQFAMTGTVYEVPGSFPVHGATVKIVQGPNAGRSAVTDGSGRYALPNMAVGTFVVEISKTEYATLDQAVLLNADRVIDFNISKGASARAPMSGVAASGPTGRPAGAPARLPRTAR